jgi:hypothetical protein
MGIKGEVESSETTPSSVAQMVTVVPTPGAPFKAFSRLKEPTDCPSSSTSLALTAKSIEDGRTDGGVVVATPQSGAGRQAADLLSQVQKLST